MELWRPQWTLGIGSLMKSGHCSWGTWSFLTHTIPWWMTPMPQVIRGGVRHLCLAPNWALCVHQIGEGYQRNTKYSSQQSWGEKNISWHIFSFRELSILDRGWGSLLMPSAGCSHWKAGWFRTKHVPYRNVAHFHLLILWKSFRILQWEEKQKNKQVHFLWVTKLSIHF